MLRAVQLSIATILGLRLLGSVWAQDIENTGHRVLVRFVEPSTYVDARPVTTLLNFSIYYAPYIEDTVDTSQEKSVVVLASSGTGGERVAHEIVVDLLPLNQDGYEFTVVARDAIGVESARSTPRRLGRAALVQLSTVQWDSEAPVGQ